MLNVDVVRQIRVTVPDLHERIKKETGKSNKSVQVLATEAGISTAYWYQMMKGERSWISEEVLEGIEKALGVSFGVEFDSSKEGD